MVKPIEHEFKSTKLLVVSGEHLIQDWLYMRSYCGLRLEGWRYTDSIVNVCGECKANFEGGGSQA